MQFSDDNPELESSIEDRADNSSGSLLSSAVKGGAVGLAKSLAHESKEAVRQEISGDPRHEPLKEKPKTVILIAKEDEGSRSEKIGQIKAFLSSQKTPQPANQDNLAKPVTTVASKK